MENITLIRVIAGFIAIAVFFALAYRMKKKAPR